jgi:hypothetical protein
MKKPIRLPVKWVAEDKSTEELEELEKIGVDTDDPEYSTPGYLYVFPEHITAYNKASKDRTTIRLTDGNAYMIIVSFKEFHELILTYCES